MKTCLLVPVAALALVASAAAADLVPGSAAPKLADVQWLQGAPVPDWGKDHVYVLDFWATWCGPCKASIPHLNELHNRYKDKGVTFIGVAIWPRAKMVPTADFVRDKGAEMAYSICEDVDGKTAKAFMEASGSGGIPTAMIVDQSGHVAWIGHPMDGLDEVLPAVLEKRFDAQAYAREKQAIAAAKEALDAAFRAEDWAAVATRAQAVIDINPKRFGQYAIWKYDALVRGGQAEQAAQWGREAVKGFLADSDQALNGLAWRIVDPDVEGEARDLELALSAAQRADEVSGHANPSTIDTLARVYFLKGDLGRAIELQQKAAGLAEGALKTDLEQRLAEYKAAKEAKGT